MIDKLKREGVYWVDEGGCSHETRASYLQTEIMGLCGCGNPDEVMMYIASMLKKLDNKEYGEYEDMPYMFFVYWADDKGFVEHGTSVRLPWLTDKGKELLADIGIVATEM